MPSTKREKERGKELMKAIQGNESDRFYNLIDQMEVSELQKEDECGRTALFIASSSDNLPFLRSLLSRGVDIRAKTKWGENALFFAAEKGNVKILQYLIDHGLRYALNSTDIKGNSILHYASMSSLSAVRYLLSIRADKKAKGDMGRNCVHFAAMGGKLSIVRYFLENHQTNFPINQLDAMEMNAFHLATETGNLPIMKYLVQKGIDYKRDTKFQTDALFIATRANQREAIEYLLEIGFDLNRENKYGSKVIHIAATEENFSLVKYFVRLGIDVNATNRYLQTPLSLSLNHFEMVNFLLRAGGDIFGVFPHGRSLLHLALLKKSKSQNITPLLSLLTLSSLSLSPSQLSFLSSLSSPSPYKFPSLSEGEDREEEEGERERERREEGKRRWKEIFVGAIEQRSELMSQRDNFNLLFSDYSNQLFLNLSHSL